MIKTFIKTSLKAMGMEIKRYPDQHLRSKQLAMKKFGINKILDVGANAGQFVMETRNQGFDGLIISFEPLSTAFQLLKKNSASDNKWTIRNMAIGDLDGEITIHISKNSFSSSIREILPLHLESAQESVYINQEQVKISRLDTIFMEYYKEGDHILLKIDTQGYEKNVIDGATESLAKIQGIRLEMSFVPLYKGEMLFWDIAPYILKKGFSLYSLENGFYEPKTGRLLQADGIFYREE